jgi:hypothetical protein
MTSEIINNTLYRFRSIDKLLGDEYLELENQTIYFSPPEHLNDPVEGLRDIYFSGDLVLWRNLFKNYISCLLKFTFNYLCYGEKKNVKDNFDIFANEDDIHAGLKPSLSLALDGFFKDDGVKQFLDNVVKYRGDVSRLELMCYLSIMHPIALEFVILAFKTDGIINLSEFNGVDSDNAKALSEEYFNIFNNTIVKQGRQAIDDYFVFNETFLMQQYLAIEYDSGILQENRKALNQTFPSLYMNSIEKLMYPHWFTACFMSKATNSSVWGNYGCNHSGVCLIFNTEHDGINGHYLSLTDVQVGYGDNGPIIGDAKLKFYEVTYSHKQKPLNFFDSLGRLPIPKFNKQWLVDMEGCQSSLRVSFDSEWRNKYWCDFYSAITQKTKDWEYENEHRLIINDMLSDHDASGVTLKYDFRSLKGIIFGIRTSSDEKLKIMKIIKRKMHENNRDNFEFYQAYYCLNTGEIKHASLDVLIHLTEDENFV